MEKWTWNLDAETLGIAFLIMGDAAAFWSANNPSVFTVRAFRRKGGSEADQTATDIRIGGLAGTSLAIIVGFGGSLITKSWWPLAAATAVIGFQWFLWEWAIANPHSNSQGITNF